VTLLYTVISVKKELQITVNSAAICANINDVLNTGIKSHYISRIQFNAGLKSRCI